MEIMEFFEKVEAHQELTGMGLERVEQGKPGVIVRHLKSGLATRLPLAAIEEAQWEVIEEILTCQREPVVLQHMTRVVGYYSRIDNWNKSKLGELEDRHKGNYVLPGEKLACV